jgi:hypothetical protein
LGATPRVRLGEGELDDEARSAIRWELGPDAAAVQFDDLAADVQPEAHSGEGRVAVDLVEALEDVGAVLRRDPESMVAHPDRDQAPARGVDLDVNVPALRAVLDRVVQEVGDNLLQSEAVD